MSETDLIDIGKVFHDFDALQVAALTLIHRHFQLGQDEVMVHSRDGHAKGYSCSRRAISTAGSVLPHSLLFQNDGTLGTFEYASLATWPAAISPDRYLQLLGNKDFTRRLGQTLKTKGLQADIGIKPFYAEMSLGRMAVEEIHWDELGNLFMRTFVPSADWQAPIEQVAEPTAWSFRIDEHGVCLPVVSQACYWENNLHRPKPDED